MTRGITVGYGHSTIPPAHTHSPWAPWMSLAVGPLTHVWLGLACAEAIVRTEIT